MKGDYYCGPKGTPKILQSKYFKKACRLHDDDYKTGYYDRKIVDDWFYQRMLKIAENNKLRKAHAYLYYKLVRLFGWIFYGK